VKKQLINHRSQESPQGSLSDGFCPRVIKKMKLSPMPGEMRQHCHFGKGEDGQFSVSSEE
jgi:hypothetical protein